jgi:Leucine-rich repeat (LRR) protein
MADDVQLIRAPHAVETEAPLPSALLPKRASRLRRWLQFSMRSVFLLTTVAAVLMSLVGVPVFRLRQEQLASEWLEMNGAHLTFEGATGPTAWLAEKAYGKKAAMHVTKVDLAWQSIDDEGASHLGPLRHLTMLNLDGATLTDRGLRYISGCQSLERLQLHGAPITDAGVRHLATLSALENLDLSSTKITGANLEPLLQLTELEILNLNGSRLTDAALPVLSRLKLRWLGVSHTRMSEAADNELAIALPNTAIDD